MALAVRLMPLLNYAVMIYSILLRTPRLRTLSSEEQISLPVACTPKAIVIVDWFY